MSTKGARVVVVDDEPVVRQFLQIALSDMGCCVETFGTCQEGLERVRNCDFDIAFVDKNLPDGSGLTICQALSDANCKVALVTGYANLTSAVEAMRHGVADYFTKPIDLDDLTARLTRMLTQLRLERANRALVEELQDKCSELERVAARDPTTGIFNHSHFQSQVDAEVERSRGKQRFSVAFIAIDRFATVNEQVGHTGGDQVLRQVAGLLAPPHRVSPDHQGMPRPIGMQDIVCRLGGDTFAVILPGASRAVAASRLSVFRAELGAFQFGQGLPVLTASIGIAQYPEDGENRKQLLQGAERALAQAKGLGGDNVLCYEADGDGPTSNAEVRAVRALGALLANRSVRFVYQPIVSVSARMPIAYEALCRPTSPAYRHVGDLLDAAARTGRIVELGKLTRSVAIMPLPDLNSSCRLFVNVHPHELEGGALLEAGSVIHAVAERIVLEITETDQIGDYDLARERIRELRKLGFRIALDDFGAGYQGFNSLAMLEPDFVKLDMGIVRGITHDSRAARLVRHIREFCDGEGIRTIAEGVETALEYRTLLGLGIDLMQGYLFAKPAEPFCSIAVPLDGQDPVAAQ